MQRLIVCCDGSWRNLASNYPSNVIKMAQAITELDAEGIRQVVYYGEGIGSNNKSRIGGILGLGIDENILDAYKFLALNYHPGDEIYLFGFSRGAYTARSIAGLIYCSGLVGRQHMRNIPEAYELYRDPFTKPGSQAAREFRKTHGERAPIEVLGCWDTVGALGIPFQIPGTDMDDDYNARFAFHDTCVNPSVKYALHAKAIDELRSVFEVTPMFACKGSGQIVEEVWFPGDHSSIGGGKIPKAPLSNRCLIWMLERMETHGLKLSTDQTRIEDGIACDHSIDFDNQIQGMYKLAGEELRSITGIFDQLDVSVKRRWRDRPDYRPKNLSRRFRSKLDEWKT
ncbi:DUF2235 domain-containing protein [Opitutales bacterium]|nr:DUF2235 domain-containing protein [Opitutales bacterium]